MNWEQLKAVIWLRWRLSRNRFGRAGPLNAVLAVLFLALLGPGAVLAGIIGFGAGAFGLAAQKPEVLLWTWDGVLFVFLIVWLSGLMIQIQRSESIALEKLLHLPVTLRQVFVFNYAASHATPSLVLFVPAVLGLCAGLACQAGARLALLIPLVLGFVFMLTAWTYCLRGWLAALMVNKRRRRAIIVWITIVFVAIAQLPNLLVHSVAVPHKGRRAAPAQAAAERTEVSGNPSPMPDFPAGEEDTVESGLPGRLILPHLAVPAGWVGYAAMALRRQDVWPALVLTTLTLLLGGVGLARAYRMTVRFYRGADGDQGAREPEAPAAASRGPLLVERRLPWVPEEAAALALATFRSLLRTPELKMALIMPLVLGLLMTTARFTRPAGPPSPYLTALAATAAALLAAFSFAPTMSNVFGLDRNGFRALVLLPTPRHYILLAKNLAFLPFAGLAALVLLALAAFLVKLPVATVLAGLVQSMAAFVLFSPLGNLISVLVPYRMAPGTLQARKPKPIVFLGVFGMMLTLPVIAVPVLVPTGLQALFTLRCWTPWLPVQLVSALLLLGLVLLLYWALLPLEGRLLQRREQTILREVTEETE